MQINYYINGQEVNRPLNYKELSVELNYDKDDNLNQAVSLTEFEFGLGSQTDGKDAADYINDYLDNGNVFEGLPIQVELEHEGTSYILFDGYLDCSKALFDCDRVIVQGVEKKNVDWLNDVADSKTFEYLYEVEGIITDDDFINVPYVLSSLPDNQEALLATISLVFLIDTIVGQVFEISSLTSGFTSWPNGSDAVKLGLSIAYTISLLAFALMTIKQIINSLVQKIKYHSAMSELKHAQRAAQSFGYTFSSSILENEFKNSYIIPRKYNLTDFEDEEATLTGININFIKSYSGANAIEKITRLGNTNSDTFGKGYFKGTIGDFFRELKKKYNAKIIIEGNVLKLERRDYNNSAYNYIVPPVDQTQYSLNSNELKANYVINFATDINDKNTIQRYYGNSTQVITEPIAARTDLTLLSGLEEVNLAFSRARKKDYFTNVEKVIKFYLTMFDGYVNIFIGLANVGIVIVNGAITLLNTIASLLGLPKPIEQNLEYIQWSNSRSLITDRLGMLLMENDFIDVPKMVILSVNSNARNTTIADTDETKTNSLYLYNNYHFINSFVPSNEKPNANQYKIYEVNGVPFCFDEYELLRTSNYLQNDELKDGELLSLKWNVEEQTATINYKINELYTNKLREQKITPNGQ